MPVPETPEEWAEQAAQHDMTPQAYQAWVEHGLRMLEEERQARLRQEEAAIERTKRYLPYIIGGLVVFVVLLVVLANALDNSSGTPTSCFYDGAGGTVCN